MWKLSITCDCRRLLQEDKQRNFYFWLCWIFIAARGLSVVEARWGYSLFTLQGLLISVASRCRARALGHAGSVILAPGL